MSIVPQVISLWIIILCVAAGSVHSEDLGLERERNQNDDATSLDLEKKSWVMDNVTDPTESETLSNFSILEVNLNNDSLPAATSTLSVSVVDKNETSTLPSASDNRTDVSTELVPTEEVINGKISEGSEASTIATPSTTVTSEDKEPDECVPDHCVKPNNCIFTKNSGCIRLRENGTQVLFVYTIIVPDVSSLISVEMEPEKDLLPNSTITFHFIECGKTQLTWKIEARKKIRRKTYVSTGHTLTLRIRTEDSWINYAFSYKALAYEHKKTIETVDDGIFNPRQLGEMLRPNIQVSRLLGASKSRWNESSVVITVSFVDLDVGDYLLIGAGKNPLAGPEPFYFSGRITKSKDYYVANDDAYITFKSGPSQEVDKKRFSIRWKRSGTAITTPDEEPEEETIPDYIVQSVGICFYNKSLIAEFNRSDDADGPLQKFREKLASIANRVAKEKSIPLDPALTASSVEIFRVSAIIEPIEDVMPAGGIYAMVSIVQKNNRKTAVFRRRQLEEIIDRLDKTDEEAGFPMLGFKAGRCPHVENYVEWYIAAVLLVIISTIALIVVWICSSVSKWKRSTKRNSSNQFDNVYCREPDVPARENDYIRYTPGLNKPQLRLTTSEGDSATLDSETLDMSRSDQDDGPDTVLYHTNWIMQRRPSSLEVPNRTTVHAEVQSGPVLQTFAAPLPTTKRKGSALMWRDDGIKMDTLLLPKTTQPVDHEYDSLIFPSTSSSRTCLIAHESETKL